MFYLLLRRTINILRYKLGDKFVDFGLYLMHKSNVELKQLIKRVESE